MVRYVALLRGINVGGRNKVAMSELRAVLADMGLVGVTTYLQSGNVVFDAGSLDAGALAGSISAKVAARFGVAVHVLLRTTAELGAVVAGSPLGPRTVDPSRYFVAFFSGVLDPVTARDVESLVSGEELLVVGRTEAYLSCANGPAAMAWVKLIEARSMCVATVRNWNTLNKLVSLTQM